MRPHSTPPVNNVIKKNTKSVVVVYIKPDCNSDTIGFLSSADSLQIIGETKYFKKIKTVTLSNDTLCGYILK